MRLKISAVSHLPLHNTLKFLKLQLHNTATMETLFIFAAIYIGFLLVFSSLSYQAIRNDYIASQGGGPRTPEWKLHALELFGGVVGSYFAQRILRHKLNKMSYQYKFFFIIGLHIGIVLVALYYREFINYLHLPCLNRQTVA